MSVFQSQSAGRRFAILTIGIMLISIVAQTPVLGASSTIITLDKFDEGTTALDLYLDQEGSQVSFTLPAKAKVLDAQLKVEGILPPPLHGYKVGDAPVAIEAADVDGDGDIDLGVANSQMDSVSVLLNNGQGRFDKTGPLDFMVGREPTALTFADLDNDGAKDLAAVNASDGSVTVRLSKSEMFGSMAAYKVGGNLALVAVADLDNDTYKDLVIVREQFPVIAVLFNKGDGAFNPPVDVQIMASPEGAAIVDVDRDGRMDILLASTERPYSVIVVKNKGGKQFEEGDKYGVEWPPSDLVATDLTGDGRMDLVVPSLQGNMSIFINTGTGYGTPAVLRYPRQQAAIAGDLDNDGVVDVVSVSRWDSTVRTFINRGQGQMALDQLFLTGGNPSDVTVADLDGDGDLDIATADNADDTVSVALNSGRGRFAWNDMYDIIESDKMVTLGDLDGDKDLDAVSTNYAYQTVTLAYNEGNGQFTKVSKRPGYKVFVGGSGGSEPFYPTIADYDADGDNDIEYAEELSDAIIMMFNDGNGVFREDSVAHEFGQNLLPAPAYVTLPVDVNKDMALDMVCIHMNWDFISILLNDGTGHFYKRLNHSLDGGHAYDIVAEDFDADGNMDFVTANYGIGVDYETNLTFIRNDGKGNFSNVKNLKVKMGPKSLTFADMNKDGKRDIVVAFAAKKSLTDIQPGEVAVILAESAPMTFKDPVYYRVGIMPGKVHTTDLNDDNVPDIICLNQGTGEGGSISVLINNGDGTLKPQIEYSNVPYKYSAFADLNADDRDEVVVPLLGTHLGVYRALYYPGNVVFSGPADENIWVNPGLFQIEQLVNLTASVSSFVDSAGKDSTGNVTYTMNLTAGRAGVVKVTGLSVRYKIELPRTGEENKSFSIQGLGIMFVLLGLLIIVGISVSSPTKAGRDEPAPKKAPAKGASKKKDEEDLGKPGPVIVRKPEVQVKAGKEEWDRPAKPKAVKKSEPAKEVKPAAIKVEVQKGGWKPSKSTLEKAKFEKAADMRDEIKKDKRYKKKDNGK